MFDISTTTKHKTLPFYNKKNHSDIAEWL